MRALKTVTLVATTVLATHAQACDLAEMAGRWQAYAHTYDEHGPYWVRCIIEIDATGKFSSPNCQTMGRGKGEISQGRLYVADTTSCTIAGSFYAGDNPTSIDHATLSVDKSLIGGVGASTYGPITFTLMRLAP